MASTAARDVARSAVGLVASAALLAGCGAAPGHGSSPAHGTGSPAATSTSVAAPPGRASASSSPGSIPGTSTPTAAAAGSGSAVPTAQVARIGVEIDPQDVVLTLSSHVDDLGTRAQDARLTTPTQFDLTLVGIQVTGPLGATQAAAGDVSAVSFTTSASGTSVHVALRTPTTKFQVTVGAGNLVQLAFGP